MSSIKKNIASQNVTFCLVNSSTGGIMPGATVTTQLVKDGSKVTAGGSISEIGGGQYNFAPSISDTNGTDIGFYFTATSGGIAAIPLNLDFHTDVVDSNGYPSVNLVDIAGGAVSNGASMFGINVVQWNGAAVATPNIAGKPLVDVADWLGTAVTAATAGIPDTNVKNMNNVAATSITTINANQGTTQPINFTGTGASALVKSDMTDIAGAAVSTGLAQVGVNVINWRSQAVPATSQTGVPITDPHYWGGTAISGPSSAGIPDVNIKLISGGATQGAAGYVGTDHSKITNPTATVDLSNTTIKNLDGNTVQTGDAFARLGAPAGASVSADIAAVEANALAAKNSTAGLTYTVSNKVDANLYDIAGAAVSVGLAQLGTNVVNIGNHAVTLDANNLLEVDIQDIGGAALSTGLAQIGVNLVKTLGTTSAGAAGYVAPDWSAINAPTSTQNLSGTTISTSQTIASVSGSVGSVTGAVGSVTGNVGGNVVGSVASVTGNVGGNVTGSVGSVVAAVNITSQRKKGSACTLEIFMGLASTGGPATGLTVSAVISKDGGTAAATANSVTEIGLGQYQLVLSATEMTANNIFIQATAATAQTYNERIQTQP